MNSVFGKLVGCLFLVAFTYSTAFAERKVAEEAIVFQAVKDGVFTIGADRGSGSGFLVDEGGLVLTNSHVVTSSMYISIQLDNVTRVVAVLVVEDKQKDIAVLAIAPDIVRNRPVLPLAERPTADLAFEGEKVIAVGSPLNQTRIVTSGIISKVEERAIISDVNINPGNSGGPLINMDAEVIAINTFRDPSLGSSGVAGSIPISIALPILNKARNILKNIDAPPPTHLPVVPDDPFPLEGLKWAAKRSGNANNYIVQWSLEAKRQRRITYNLDFDISISTPPRKHFLEMAEKERLAQKRRGREVSAGISEAKMYDPLGDRLKEWGEYVGDYAPLVMISVIPKTGETGGSSFANILAAGLAGYSGTTYHGIHKYEFKSDLQDFVLMNGDATFVEVFRGMGMMPVAISAGSIIMDDIAQKGIFAFLPDLFTDIDSLDLHCKIKDLKKPDREIDVPLPRVCVEQIWADFEPYRDILEAKKAKLLLPREELK